MVRVDDRWKSLTMRWHSNEVHLVAADSTMRILLKVQGNLLREVNWDGSIADFWPLKRERCASSLPGHISCKYLICSNGFPAFAAINYSRLRGTHVFDDMLYYAGLLCSVYFALGLFFDFDGGALVRVPLWRVSIALETGYINIACID